MAAEPVNSWDARVLAASESTFGTTPAPSASQALEFISIATGPNELGEVRAKKDRNIGRGMTNGYVVGRVKPMPWTLEVAAKSRGAVDTVPNENALWAAAGLTKTVNGGVSVAYSLSAAPMQDGSFSSLSLYRALGPGGTSAARYLAEQVRGGVAKQVMVSGGDRELIYKFTGDAIGKYHQGYSSSITLANGAVTSLVFANAEEGYRFALGYYQVESEIIQITAMNYATFTATIARAQLASAAVAHTAMPLYPYLPAMSYTGSPLSEVNATVTLDGQSIRFTSFELAFTSGMDLGPGETGSKYIQTPIVKRYDCKVTLKGLQRREDIALLGKSTQQKTPLAVTIVAGSGAGGIVTFSLPYCELNAFDEPDKGNDVMMVSVPLRARDNSGNDMLTVTYT